MGDLEITVRPALPGDAAELEAVFNAAVLAGWRYFADIDEMVPMFDRAFWNEFVSGTQPPDILLVATDPGDDQRVLGYVGTKAADDELWVLFVRPDAGGRGVGRRLLERAEQSLRDAGRDEVILWTHEQNRHAQRVYTAAGYRPDGKTRTDEIQSHGFREIRMVKQLRR